jgi:hypothetical protein
MSSDIFTKNVGGGDFLRHRDIYVRSDPSRPSHDEGIAVPAGEGVGVMKAVTSDDLSDVMEVSGTRKRKRPVLYK